MPIVFKCYQTYVDGNRVKPSRHLNDGCVAVEIILEQLDVNGGRHQDDLFFVGKTIEIERSVNYAVVTHLSFRLDLSVQNN